MQESISTLEQFFFACDFYVLLLNSKCRFLWFCFFFFKEEKKRGKTRKEKGIVLCCEVCLGLSKLRESRIELAAMSAKIASEHPFCLIRS